MVFNIADDKPISVLPITQDVIDYVTEGFTIPFYY